MLKRAVLSCFRCGQGLDFAAFSVSFVLGVIRIEASGRGGTWGGNWNNPDFSLGRSPDLLVSQQTVVHLVPPLCCPN